MVITVEPGIYVPPVPQFPKAFHNMGIRIDSEDEVLVGKNHPVVLSVAAPKEIVDVEGACQGQLGLEPPRIFSHLTPSVKYQLRRAKTEIAPKITTACIVTHRIRK
ncbi:hypothetical protein EV363DRAFT_195270 [Boletus edulis]|nr:hypothetical protein EV363DRAFT_195270 [Boletus edulis]